MENQLSFEDNSNFDIGIVILNIVKKVFDENGISTDNLHFKKNIKDYNLMLHNKIFIKFIPGKKDILAKKYYKNYLESNNISYTIHSIPSWLIIDIDDLTESKKIENLILEIYFSEFTEYDFSCCSRYLECSDEKKCTQPNKTLALGCSYRRKIEKGIFFYGKNTNV